MKREDLPHIAFYIGDWRRDVGVQSLSYHYRGIWLELLMLMHCSEHRGRLVLNATPMSDASIARLLGLSPQEGANAIQVLIESAVASRDSEGAIICRRMVREEEIRQARSDAGRKGGGSKPQAKPKQNPDTDIGIENESGKQEARRRLGDLFRRKEATTWSEKETTAFDRILPMAWDDLRVIGFYYTERIDPAKDYRRRDLITLLNNWSGELDRARGRAVALKAVKPKRDLPDACKGWLLEHHEEKRDRIATWKHWEEVPYLMQQEWLKSRNKKEA